MSKFAGFNTVQLQKPQRSQFDLSHQKRMSTRMGRLTPVFVSEAIPGDTFNGSIEILMRAAPLLAPIYDSITLFVHIFFIPYRILWDEWEEFITGGRLGVGVDPVLAPVPPYYKFGDVLQSNTELFNKSMLLDYLGMPLIKTLPGYTLGAFTAGDQKFECLVPLAYQQVYFDYYRDRNFTPDSDNVIPVPSGDLDAHTLPPNVCGLRTRAWEHDYFTSALPWTQRGEEVLMPLSGTGSVTYLNNAAWFNSDGTPNTLGTTDWASFGSAHAPIPGVVNPFQVTSSDGGTPHKQMGIANIDEVIMDASTVGINDFRTAYAMQVWLERNAIAGSRYNESTLAHFGVKPQDSRLQRAEYLGGGRIPVKISEIVSTAYSDDGEGVVPLANMAGHGVTYGNTNQFRYFCPEHGVILGIASIMSPPSYHQGMPRFFRRPTFLDYPWPTFAKLGEQQVDSAELIASPANLTEDENGQLPLFGYQSRYADWKHILNTNHGDFHDTLLFWTLTRQFASNPVLGNAFVEYDTTLQNRIFAVNQTDDNWWLYVHNHVTVVRALPYFGTPNTLNFS